MKNSHGGRSHLNGIRKQPNNMSELGGCVINFCAELTGVASSTGMAIVKMPPAITNKARATPSDRAIHSRGTRTSLLGLMASGAVRWANVKEHAPQLAGSGVETGVEVHITCDVVDTAASGGCRGSTC